MKGETLGKPQSKSVIPDSDQKAVCEHGEKLREAPTSPIQSLAQGEQLAWSTHTAQKEAMPPSATAKHVGPGHDKSTEGTGRRKNKASGLSRAHLKGLKSQCRDKYSIE